MLISFIFLGQFNYIERMDRTCNEKARDPPTGSQAKRVKSHLQSEEAYKEIVTPRPRDRRPKRSYRNTEIESQAECDKSPLKCDQNYGQTVLPHLHDKRPRRSYLNFTKVVEIFPDKSTDVLCKVAELQDFKPSKVYSLIPSATAKQICLFLELAEGSCQKNKIN